LEKVNCIGSYSDDDGGMKKFCIEVSEGEPNFSGFRLPKNLFFKKKIIKSNLQVGFNGGRVRTRGKLLDLINLGHGGFNLNLDVSKVDRVPSL
jgi:hypothetical protein